MKQQTAEQLLLKGLADLSMDNRYKNALKPIVLEKMNLALRNLTTFTPSTEDTEFKVLTKYFYQLGRHDMGKEILLNIDSAVEKYNEVVKKSNQNNQ